MDQAWPNHPSIYLWSIYRYHWWTKYSNFVFFIVLFPLPLKDSNYIANNMLWSSCVCVCGFFYFLGCRWWWSELWEFFYIFFPYIQVYIITIFTILMIMMMTKMMFRKQIRFKEKLTFGIDRHFISSLNDLRANVHSHHTYLIRAHCNDYLRFICPTMMLIFLPNWTHTYCMNQENILFFQKKK